jgi:hypothetical protein
VAKLCHCQRTLKYKYTCQREREPTVSGSRGLHPDQILIKFVKTKATAKTQNHRENSSKLSHNSATETLIELASGLRRVPLVVTEQLISAWFVMLCYVFVFSYLILNKLSGYLLCNCSYCIQNTKYNDCLPFSSPVPTLMLTAEATVRCNTALLLCRKVRSSEFPNWLERSFPGEYLA